MCDGARRHHPDCSCTGGRNDPIYRNPATIGRGTSQRRDAGTYTLLTLARHDGPAGVADQEPGAIPRALLYERRDPPGQLMRARRQRHVGSGLGASRHARHARLTFSGRSTIAIIRVSQPFFPICSHRRIRPNFNRDIFRDGRFPMSAAGDGAIRIFGRGINLCTSGGAEAITVRARRWRNGWHLLTKRQRVGRPCMFPDRWQMIAAGVSRRGRRSRVRRTGRSSFRLTRSSVDLAPDKLAGTGPG